MRFTLILENETGEQINMTTTANQYMTSEIDGLYPPAGTISTSSVYVYYSQITGAFHFPFPDDDKPFVLGTYSRTDNISIENHGDVTGFTIQIEAVADAMTPTIYNADTGEYLQIKGEIIKGDVVTITTKTGNKTVTLTRNGVDYNIINRLVSDSTVHVPKAGRLTARENCSSQLYRI